MNNIKEPDINDDFNKVIIILMIVLTIMVSILIIAR